ncbi:uncharacterized protein [Maniola hyperantus]|uniref:uncharacterized protein isoform X2 n=1 Tax=Aphantopus hyperantus TaxID=2795564 RepID=UPI0021202DA1
MYYSSILILVVISSLSGTYSERWSSDYQKSNHETPNYEPQDEVVDIGNGNYRKNVIILGPGDSQPDPLGNRFNTDSTHNINQAYPDPRKRTYTTNIGNGNHNHNIVGYGDSGSRADVPERSDPNSGGTSFVLKNDNGLDVFHVGYGKDNQNHVTVEGTPIQPGRQQSSQVEAQLKALLNLSTQLQQILNQLIQEVEKLNIQN